MDHMVEHPDTTIPDKDDSQKKRSESQGADYSTVRIFNRQLILNYLRQHGPTPRVAIAKGLGLSRATVSSVIEELTEKDFVHEGEKIGATSPGTISKGGKRATQVFFNVEAGYIIGIDVGRSRLRIYLTNLKPEIIDQDDDYSFDIMMGGEKSIPLIANKVKALVKNTYKSWEKVRGIGLALPGVPDPINNQLISPLDLAHWYNEDIAMRLRNELGLGKDFPVYLENDANMGALGESRYGKGVGVGNLIYVKLSTGIGAGLLLNGELYRGNGAAGEFGHVFVENSDRPCASCGKRGCLEATAGLQAIVEDARNTSHSTRIQALKKASITPELMADVIIAAQEEDDTKSRDALERAGKHIGKAIGSCLINIYNPSMILLDGGSVRPSKGDTVYRNNFLLKSLRQSAQDSSMAVNWAGTQILDGMLGDDAVALGTVATVIDNDKELNMPKDGVRTLLGPLRQLT
jgi:predicted NBD/HSP70 family sugar kinase